ncbi:MAG: hypothetical protein CJBNEKGG_02741 [Prosthecobacter sp.]|nr:hypothetical protein [Prosthecobacter sp.]
MLSLSSTRFFTSLAACLLTCAAMRSEEVPGLRHEKRSEDGVQAAIHFRNHPFWKAGGAELPSALGPGWMQSIGLDLAFTYDSLALGALTSGQGRGSASGDATLNMHWHINDEESRSPLSLNVRARHRHAYDDSPPSALKSQTRALWGHVDGFTDAGFQVPELYLEDLLFERRLTLRYGQMTIDDLLDGHELRSAKRSFMNQAFSSSPAVGFPGADLGFIARWQGREGWEVALALSSLTGSNLRETADWRLTGDAMFQAVQLARDFTWISDSVSRVQMLFWRADASSQAGLDPGGGVSLTLEHPLTRSTRTFIKCAWSDGQAAATSHFAAVGAAHDLSRVDRVGVAMAAGRAVQDERWQGVLELFYRRQAGRSLLITPDVQLVVGDDVAGGLGWVVVAGLRMGLTF